MTTLQIIAIAVTTIYVLMFWIFGNYIFEYKSKKNANELKKKIKELEDEQVDHWIYQSS